ncbi:hypothetical protein IF1G_01922 [Cordyceps javanica]|uniref:Nuclear pore assembly and biogenesis domain-containing protein n=1 Tax=Cordyceps javanica TaxID=43265 RepID=A0A545VDB4_9HYPO|nr:hypothetical protein IF1G_01922 [Cordyceps javanica]TQW10619.1 nuclear pore assembly and biogenesis domain-containing protein [Cordyceps javanica]
MDVTSTLSHLVTSLLPADKAALVHHHVLRADAPLQVYFAAARDSVTRGAGAAYPYVEPLVERLLAWTHASELGALLVPLAILAAAVVVMNWVRRVLLWWTRLALRAVLWATLAALAAWVWQRGLQASARDVAVLGGRVAGYAALVREIWWREYRRYEEQQNMGRATAGGGGRR